MDRNYADEMAYCEGDSDHVFKKLDKTIKDNYLGKRQTSVKKETVYWELKDGNKIDIDTMSEQHLKNVLKLIVTKNLLKNK
jgi:hypothetical protein